jgi:uncharacterized protein with PQ loop repeat
MDTLSFVAGTISSLIFASSNIPMLLKAYHTKDLHSYSALNLFLVNVGNLLYWLYIVNLPPGPIWVLHIFYTISSGILLVMYCQQAGKPAEKMSQRLTHLMQKLNFLESSILQFLAGLGMFAGTDRPIATQCGPVALVKLNDLRCDH